MRYEVKEENVKRIEKVFNKLKSVMPVAYGDIQISLCFTKSSTYDTYTGGYAADQTIVLGTEYVNRYTDEISVAELLAHELAHHILGHMNLEEDIVPLGERDADHLGMFLCELAGYSRDRYISWFNKFEEDRKGTLSDVHIEEHGTGSSRVEALKKQNEYLKELEAGRGL